MKIQNPTIIVLTLFILLWSCSNDEPTLIELDLKSSELVEASNDFGFTLFESVLSNVKVDKNVMIAPLSVSQALSMALNGAAENTLVEMKSVLDFEDFSMEDINEKNMNVVQALINHDSDVNLNISNSIWHRSSFNPKTDFIKNNEIYYNATVSSFDTKQSDKAVKAMNTWVDKNTNGKIEKIVSQIKPDDVLFLINAIYFKAEWKTKFEKSETIPVEFACENGTKKEVETMIGKADLTYKNEEKYSAIKLPYGSGKFNMIIYLPEEDYTTSEILSEIATTDFDYLNEMTPVTMDVLLPKFEFEYENTMNDELQDLGIVDAFDELEADFSNLGDGQLFISEVLHKTYIKTNEEGSEAAAATKVSFGLTSVGPGQAIRINKSFLFAIVEDDTNAILFLGKVFDPSLN